MSAATRNLALIAFLAGAYASNPDERSFRWHLEKQFRRGGDESLTVGNKVHSFLPSQKVARRDYYLFSIVRMPEEQSTYLGMFGNWIRLPRLSKGPAKV